MKNRMADEWLKAGKSDLDVIEQIIDQQHLKHMVAFHAQQCIEKCLKAGIETNNVRVPKTHSIDRLVELLGQYMDLSELALNQEEIDMLDDLYIEARYPGEMGLLPDGMPSKKQSDSLAKAAKACFCYFSGQL